MAEPTGPAPGDAHRSLLSGLDEGFVFQDADGRIIGHNQRAVDILGLDDEDLLLRTSHDPEWAAILPDGTPCPGDQHPATIALRTGEPVRDVTMGVRQGDGSYVWLRVDAHPMRDDDGRVVGVVVTFVDVEARARAEEALRANEARYRTILELAREGIWATDAGGHTLFVNRPMAKMLGATPEEMVGRPAEEFLSHEAAQRAGARLATREHFAGRTLNEIQLGRRDGRPLWVRVSTSWLDMGGGPPGVVAVITDATEERRIRLALEESERRHRALVEHSSDIITVLEPDGRWRSSSEAGSRVLGHPIGHDPEGGILALVHPDDLAIAAAAFGEVLEGTRGPDRPVLFRVQGADGSWRVLETVGRNLVDDPAIRGVVLNSRDVTDRMELADALHRRDVELERLDALRQQTELELSLEHARRLESLGRLAGGVAHDFNNLLGVILNYATIAARSADDEQLRADLEQIRRAAARGTDLTNQLLLFSRAPAGRAEAIDVRETVLDVTTMLERALPNDVRLAVDMPDEPCWVLGDEAQMEQVLVNLVLNARDAIATDGGRVRVTVRRDGDHVELTVVDDGVGMSEEVASRAFEPFFTTKPSGDGTGLGLATVHGIVARLAGTVAIDSEVGRGTTVRIHLPASDTAPPARPAASPPVESVAGRALVVDDDEAHREVTARVLRERGWQVVDVSGGADALAALSLDADYDVMVTDVVMPGVRGFELAEQVRREFGVPVVCMSGHPASAVPPPVGAPLVAKPFTEDVLLAAIADARATVPS